MKISGKTPWKSSIFHSKKHVYFGAWLPLLERKDDYWVDPLGIYMFHRCGGVGWGGGVGGWYSPIQRFEDVWGDPLGIFNLQTPRIRNM